MAGLGVIWPFDLLHLPNKYHARGWHR